VDVNTGSGQLDLRDYLQVARARKWSIILVTLLVLGVALTASFLQTPVYRSDARVLIEADPAVAVDSLDVATQVEVVGSDPIAELVREELDLDMETASLLSGLTVGMVPETKVLIISYVSTDPEFAQRAASSFASSYIDYGRAQALERIQAEQEAAQQRIDEAAAQLTTIERRLAEADRAGDETLLNTLEVERNALVARLGVLQQRLADVAAATSTPVEARVIEEARLPREPFAPSHYRNGAFGLLVGLVLGIGLAFLRERLQDRLRDREDIERAVGVPVLATIPRYRAKDASSTPITIAQPGGGVAEVYRSLRTNLQFITAQLGIKSVLITSAAAGEGKTDLVVNLGTVLAQAGHRVILVSADLRRPRLEASFGLPTEARGLATWLAGREREPWELIRDPGVSNLRVIPSGPQPPNPAELLSSPKMRHLVPTLEESCDLVIFDSPPILAVSDASVMGRLTGGTILVVDGNATHRSAVVRAKEELERTGGALIGAVLNSVAPNQSAYYTGPYQAFSVGPEDSEVATSGAIDEERLRINTKR
jgi:capsular exopolysaccharide synthesis family protein